MKVDSNRVLDCDLVIALEERFRENLPDARTVTLEEVTGMWLENPENVYDAFEITERLEDAFRKSIYYIMKLLY